jgi:hypothetical protein
MMKKEVILNEISPQYDLKVFQKKLVLLGAGNYHELFMEKDICRQ